MTVGPGNIRPRSMDTPSYRERLAKRFLMNINPGAYDLTIR